MPGCPFPRLKTARQTVPNDPEPMTSSSVIRLRDISHISTSPLNVSFSRPSSTSFGLKHRNAENYLEIKPPCKDYGLLHFSFPKMGLVRKIILNK